MTIDCQEVVVMDTGSAAFVSTPTGAEIWLGPHPGTLVDQYATTAALPGQVITGLAEGFHDYQLVLYGYTTISGTLSVTVGATTTIQETFLTVAYIVAQSKSITIRGGGACVAGSCIVDVSVTWVNSGQTSGTFTPSIIVTGGANTVTPPSYAPELLAGGAIITKTFEVTGLAEGAYEICPNPNA